MKRKESVAERVTFGKTAFGQKVYDHMMTLERAGKLLAGNDYTFKIRRKYWIGLAETLQKAGLLRSPSRSPRMSEADKRALKVGMAVLGMKPRSGVVRLGFGLGLNGSSCPPFLFAEITVQNGDWQVTGCWKETPEEALAAQRKAETPALSKSRRER